MVVDSLAPVDKEEPVGSIDCDSVDETVSVETLYEDDCIVSVEATVESVSDEKLYVKVEITESDSDENSISIDVDTIDEINDEESKVTLGFSELSYVEEMTIDSNEDDNEENGDGYTIVSSETTELEKESNSEDDE